MRGPIDYIIVGFEGHQFNGHILDALHDAIDQGTIRLVALSVINKDADGQITQLEVAEVSGGYLSEIAHTTAPADPDDVDEMAELIGNNTTAGLLVIEQLWAKPLKRAILDARGVLLAEGRIHPAAAAELETASAT